MMFLILGLDERLGRINPGYADTIILVSVSPSKRGITTMSIPRDMYISISDQEKNHIGNVYTTAEIKEPGKGAISTIYIVSKFFQVPVHYYILLNMQGFINIVDSFSGVDIILLQPTAGYPTGVTHLDGQSALAFVRHRAETDDFARMLQAQILIKGLIKKILRIQTWNKILQIIPVAIKAIKSNIPFWEWPKFAFIVLLSKKNGIKSYTITRDLVSPTITSQGEPVIEPHWDKIIALTHRLFMN